MHNCRTSVQVYAHTLAVEANRAGIPLTDVGMWTCASGHSNHVMCLAVATPSVCGCVLCAWVVCLHQHDNDHVPCCCPAVVRNKRFRPQVHRKRPFELEMVLVGLHAHCSLHSTTHFIFRSCPEGVHLCVYASVAKSVLGGHVGGLLPRLCQHFMSLTPVLCPQPLPLPLLPSVHTGTAGQQHDYSVPRVPQAVHQAQRACARRQPGTGCWV
jgi:hypothetical protein